MTGALVVSYIMKWWLRRKQTFARWTYVGTRRLMTSCERIIAMIFLVVNNAIQRVAAVNVTE